MAHMRVMRRLRGDEGSGLVFALAVVLIVFTLGATWLAYADHQSGASSYERLRQRAFDASNEGLARAQSSLASGGAGTTTLTTAADGSAQFEVTVTAVTGAPTRRQLTAVGYAPAKSSTRRAVRRLVQVVEIDPPGYQFSYALQAMGPVALWNNGTVIGNVYAEDPLVAHNNLTIDGDLLALNTVELKNNSTVDILSNAAVIVRGNLSGRVRSRVKVTLDNKTQDGAVVQAPVVDSCSKVQNGSCSQSMPPDTVPTLPYPTFTPDASYQSITPAAMATLVGAGPVSGKYRVTGSLNLDKKTLKAAGPLTIYVEGNIKYLPGNIQSASSAEFVDVRLIARDDIEGDNNFDSSADVRLLLFTQTGKVAFNNKPTFHGALYSFQNLDVKNTMNLTFAVTDGSGFSVPGGTGISRVRNVSIREVNA